jgi:hypothetical protein
MQPAAPKHSNGNVQHGHQASGNAHKPDGSPAQKGHGQGRAVAMHGEMPARDKNPGKGFGKRAAVVAAHEQAGPVKVLKDGRHLYSQRDSRPRFDFVSARRGLIDGCPPGLAKKNNGCQPPGQAMQRTYSTDWWGLPGLGSGPYVYDSGYLYRMNGAGVAGYIPLLGGALTVGNIWPRSYAPLPVPQYYVDYYDLGPVGGYRYADNVLYRVDPTTAAITSVAALLTGDNILIGSPMPPGYGVYNVPYPYRAQYVDGPNAWYRYSDGYVYQVDPTTQLVTAAIDLLAS